MLITIDLHKNIYDQLATEAESKGLTIEELIRVTLGERVGYSIPRFLSTPSLPPQLKETTDKLSRMTDIFLNK